MTTRTYPLLWPEGWPRTEPHRRSNRDPFKVETGKVIADLRDELNRFKAQNAVISTNVPVGAT